MCTLWGREITEVAQTEKTPNLTHSVRNEKSYFYIFYPLASLTTFFNEVEKLYVMRSRSLFTEVDIIHVIPSDAYLLAKLENEDAQYLCHEKCYSVKAYMVS